MRLQGIQVLMLAGFDILSIGVVFKDSGLTIKTLIRLNICGLI